MTKFKHNNTFRRAALTLLALVMTCATAWADTETVSYIDADGNTQTVTATILTGSEDYLGTSGQTTWYVVNSNISYSSSISCSGYVNIILADGKTMTVNSGPIGGSNLTIYGQSGQSGILNATNPQSTMTNAIQLNQNLIINGGTVNANCYYGAIFCGSSFIINRGTVNATSGTSSGYGIKADYVTINDGNVTTNAQFGIKVEYNGGITINGGNVTANGSWGIYAFCNITLGWSNASDRIYASKYYVDSGHTISIAEGKYFKDANSNNWFFGNVNASDIDGKTLQPATQAEYIQYYLGTGNDGSAQHPYTISDAISWNVFCDAFEDNDTWNHFSSGFSGKIVKLGANISVSRMAGNNDHPFTGTFDGDGKTLTFNYGSDGTPSNEDYIAPFRYTNGATISGLHVSGNIYTNHTHSAGIIGLASGTTTVSNCRSSININSSVNGDGTHGGIAALVASGNGITLNISGCLFDGKIVTTNGTTNCGGFVGHNNSSVTITNSIFAPNPDDNTVSTGCATFGRNVSSDLITNSYYTAALGTVQGKLRHSITAGANTTVANAGTATTYDVSGITSYGTGILYDGVLYAGNGDAVSLTLTHQDPPEGYAFNGYIPSAGTLEGTILTMPDEDVTISAPWAPISYAITYNLEGGNLPTGQSNPESYTIESNDIELVNPIKSGYNFVGWTGTGLNGPTQTVIIAQGSMGIREYTAIWSVSVNYIDENGVEQTVTALPLIGNETTLDPGWYVVENTNPNGVDLAYTEGLSCSNGNLNLILCDGAEMTVTGAYTQDAITLDGAYTLTIYGQSQMSGKLTLTGSEYGKCIQTNDGNIVMNGGIVNATADTDGAIKCNNFIMNGGSFSATSNSTDYSYDHTIEIGDSFTFNGGNFSAFSANAYGIEGAWSPVNLSWTNTSDSFYVSSLGQVSINIAEGKDFIDEDNTLHTHNDPGEIAGKTLRPFNGCYLPMHLTATAITTNTATLTWEAGNEEAQWQVSWSTDGGSNWSTPVTVNNVPQYEITSLSPETIVQAQVKSVCDESVYSAPISITFTTRSLCDAPESLTCNSYSTSAVLGWTGYQDSYNVRYCTVTFGDAATATEDFEHDNEMPEGWTMLDLGDGNNTNELGISTEAAQDGGSYGFRFSSFNGNSEGSFDQYLISPELNNLSALSFYYRASSTSSSGETFRVGYSTTTNDVSAFTWVSNGTTTSTEFSEFVEDASSIPAHAKYFAINYTAVYQYRLYIDNITYTYTPLIVGTWNETNTSVTSPLTIRNLTPETPYAWQVQGINATCDGGLTDWSEMGTFTTQPLPAISYIDADGTTQQCTNYTVLTGNSSGGANLSAGWYVVNSNITYTGTVNLGGDVNIILCDGYTMNVGTTENPVSSNGIYGSGHSINIYAQSRGNSKGQLHVNSSVFGIYIYSGDIVINGGEVSTNGDYCIELSNGNITINGGEVSANGGDYGVYIYYGDITINGGEVSANGGIYGIYTFGGNITLGWTNASDFIYANSYEATDGTLSIAPNKAFIDTEGNIYESGPVDASAIAGKTLYPKIAGTVPYIDENGQLHILQPGQYTLLTGTETTLGTADQETWYVANTYYNYNHKLSLTGDVHLILCDGAQVYLSQEYDDDVNYDVSIKGDDNLTIYGQTNGTGTLNSYMIFTNGAITINGGTINVYGYQSNGATPASILTKESFTVNGGTINTSCGDNGIYVIPYGLENPEISYNCTINGGTLTIAGISNGIYANGDVIINGGQVQATGDGGNGIVAKNLTLGWTYATDYIYANSYSVSNNKTIVAGQALIDNDGNIYSGTLNYAQLMAMYGKTLHPLVNAVTRTIEGYGDSTTEGWVFISSPVTGSIAPNTVTNIFSAAEYDLYRFNQSAANGKEWQNYKAHTSDFNLVNGQGYLYATKETKTLVFTGEFNTDNTKTVDLVYDNNAELKGWNLVGNPFITTATLSQPYYRMNDEGTALKTETETSAVAAMEGVFVQATGNDQTVTFTAQTRGGEQSAVAMLNVLLGKVLEPVEGPTQNNGVSTSSTTLTLDNAIVRFDGGQTLEKFSFREGSTKLYIPQGGTDYAIATSEGQGELPVNFEAEKNGTYTLSFSSQEVSFSYLHLIDNMTGDDIDLLPHYKGGRGDSQPATYTFQAKTTDYASRFKLVFVTDGEDSPSTGSETFAYYNGSEWMISNTGRATLQVVDAMGRVLRSETINGNATINTNGLSAGVYMLRLINSEDVRAQKIVVR